MCFNQAISIVIYMSMCVCLWVCVYMYAEVWLMFYLDAEKIGENQRKQQIGVVELNLAQHFL